MIKGTKEELVVESGNKGKLSWFECVKERGFREEE